MKRFNFFTISLLALSISAFSISQAKAYDNNYSNNAAIIGLTAVMMGGAGLSSAYNNTPVRVHHVAMKSEPHKEMVSISKSTAKTYAEIQN